MFLFFFFNDTATTEIYTLSLHDALPICLAPNSTNNVSITYGGKTLTWSFAVLNATIIPGNFAAVSNTVRSEEHTSELQSRPHLVCRLLLEKKKSSVPSCGSHSSSACCLP